MRATPLAQETATERGSEARQRQSSVGAHKGWDLVRPAVREFALPVPSLVICELLGVPYVDRDEALTVEDLTGALHR